MNRLVQASGFQTVVLDHNPETIAVMRRFGFKAYLGDPTRPDILRKAGLKDARVLMVALDDPKAALALIAYARKERPDLTAPCVQVGMCWKTWACQNLKPMKQSGCSMTMTGCRCGNWRHCGVRMSNPRPTRNMWPVPKNCKKTWKPRF